MIPTISYPTSPPQIFHTIIVTRLASNVYYGYFPDSQLLCTIDCITIAIKLISDSLYIRYVVSNYTAIFGILDILSDIIFLILILIPNETISTACNKISDICGIKFNYDNNMESEEQPPEIYLRYSREYDETRRHYIYSTIPTDNNTSILLNTGNVRNGGKSSSPPPPSSSPSSSPPSSIVEHTTYSSNLPTPLREIHTTTPQHHHPRLYNAFKPNFYRSTQKEPNNEEYQPIKNTMYVNFDEYDQGAANYANTLVSPYFDHNGSPITVIHQMCQGKTREYLFLFGNILHFICQIMIYINITNTCKSYTVLDNIQKILC